MKVFLTGGMGFIGSYIAVELLAKGDEVTILARDPNKIPRFLETPGISVAKGGLDDLDVIREALEGKDACIHNALYWGDTPTKMLLNDTRASVSVFEAAAEAGVKHLIYTSSTAAIGPFKPHMEEGMHISPSDYYGATKASTEAFLSAFSYRTEMRCNTVRPGYTIGNPVVEGAPIFSDTRFKTIVHAATHGEDIFVTKNDGTQFVWAGDLAKIYSSVLHSDVNRQIYFGLAQDFASWEQIARDAVALAGSSSKVVVEDKGYSDTPNLFDLGKIEREFGLSFRSQPALTDHLKYLIGK
jgi:UDP-glucose 4-epimerase